jgi:hypothetical protein
MVAQMTGYKSKRAAARDKLNDEDDTQVYKDHGDALTIAYQSGYYDGKKAAQREWVGLTEEDFSAINQSCFTKLQAATSAESILKEKNT